MQVQEAFPTSWMLLSCWKKIFFWHGIKQNKQCRIKIGPRPNGEQQATQCIFWVTCAACCQGKSNQNKPMDILGSCGCAWMSNATPSNCHLHVGVQHSTARETSFSRRCVSVCRRRGSCDRMFLFVEMDAFVQLPLWKITCPHGRWHHCTEADELSTVCHKWCAVFTFLRFWTLPVPLGINCLRFRDLHLGCSPALHMLWCTFINWSQTKDCCVNANIQQPTWHLLQMPDDCV